MKKLIFAVVLICGIIGCSEWDKQLKEEEDLKALNIKFCKDIGGTPVLSKWDSGLDECKLEGENDKK